MMYLAVDQRGDGWNASSSESLSSASTMRDFQPAAYPYARGHIAFDKQLGAIATGILGRIHRGIGLGHQFHGIAPCRG